MRLGNSERPAKDGTQLAMPNAEMLIESRNRVEQGKQTQKVQKRDEEPMRLPRITSNQKADVKFLMNRTTNS